MPNSIARLLRLQEATAALSEALAPVQVADVVIEHAVPALGASGGAVYVPADGDGLAVLRGSGMPEADDGLADQAARERTAVWRSPPTRAALPLIAEGGLFGVLELAFDAGRTVDDSDRRLALTLAQQCAQALLRARLYRDLEAARARAERHGQRASRLLAVTSDLTLALTPDEVAAAVVLHGVEGLGARSGAIWMIDGARTRLRMLRSLGYPDSDRFTAIPLDLPTPVGDAVRSARPVFLESRADYAARYPASSERDQELDDGPLAVACLPLVAEGQVHGAVALAFSDARSFDTDERTFLVLMANQAAQALERARRLEAERAERERLALLSAAGARLAASLEYEETLSSVATLVIDHGLADWCAVDIVDARTGEPQQLAVAHKDPAKVEMARELRRRFPPDPDAERGVSAVLRTGRPEIYPDITAELIAAATTDPDQRALIAKLGMRSAMVVPMATTDRVSGAITFVHAESGRNYGDDDLALAEELARRAAMAVENARLYSSAQLAIRARDDMLAIVSHDLKNPLGVISMQAEMLARDEVPGPDRIRAAAARIQRAGDRMQRMINDLLDMASLDEGTLRLDLEPTSLPALIRDAIDAQAPAATAARLNLAAGDVADVRVPVDRERLFRVLANLLANAIRHTANGGSILVDARVADGEVQVSVRDTGSGIPAEDLERVFDRFWRSTDHGKGTGLGLAICKGLVEAHGGRIWAASEEGKGSTFTFALPATGRAAVFR